MDNFSRAILSSAVTRRQDLSAFLSVLYRAAERYEAPETLVTDSGSVFLSNRAKAVYGKLGVGKEEIEKGRPWQNYSETTFGIQRRMADWHFQNAENWSELVEAHERFVEDYKWDETAETGWGSTEPTIEGVRSRRSRVDQSRKEASAMPQPYSVTAGIDLGDRYTHLCLVDGEEGEVIEESRIPTTRRAFQRRFSEAEPMRVAIEAGTHSPWVSRVLESCGHDVLVANARKVKLIYGEGKNNDKVDALRSWRVLPGSIPDYLPRYSIVGRIRKHTWRSYARGRRWWVPGPSS